MKYSFQCLSLVLIFFTTALEAQTDMNISKKNFKNNKAGFDEAWKHVTDGDDYFKKKGLWYGNAFEEYVKAGLYNGVVPELNYKTGIAALFSDNREKAVTYFQKVMEEKPDLAPDVSFFTGRALQYAGRYSEAIAKLNDYLASGGKKPEGNVIAAKKYIEECNSALAVVKDTLRIAVRNLGSGINSSSDEYSEILTADGKTMFFASRRELPKSNQYPDARYDENIFISNLISGSWGMASIISKKLVTKYCETPLYINDTGDMLYIYTGYENGGDIKVSEKKRGEWKAPEKIPFSLNTGGSETSITFSPSGNEVWFVTDKGKGGLGGKDIYMIRKTGGKKWSKPYNPGPSVNTQYDEESPRFSDKGDTLWFSSSGHNTIGGFDIFYSVKDQNGNWSKAVNYGYPVNTQWDELFYFPVRGNDSLFYFSSNRPGSLGGLDIFEGRILPLKKVIPPPPPPQPETKIIRDTVVIIKEVVQPPVVPPAPVAEPPKETGIYLIGKVKDSETGDPVLAKIDIIDFATDAQIATTASSDVDGSYRIKLPAKKSYMVDLRATGFLSDMKRVNIPENYAEDSYTLDVPLIKVKVGKKVVLNNILFETGKAVLTTSSYAELDRLTGILEDSPNMRIEISGHTDNTGTPWINNKLSEDRAKAVVGYLVKKGIAPERLESKGFGSQQPIADNNTAAGRTKNRRVEFKILEL